MRSLEMRQDLTSVSLNASPSNFYESGEKDTEEACTFLSPLNFISGSCRHCVS